jgi:peptidoglycan/LPS O-acetylase OafA/YrhL
MIEGIRMIKKVLSIYSIIIGTLIIGMWLTFILTGRVPEINTNLGAIILHLIAELLTASLLLLGGYGLITNNKWGLNLNLAALGMLLYTVIMSPGYYLVKGETVFIMMFGILIVLTLIFIIISILKYDQLNE